MRRDDYSRANLTEAVWHWAGIACVSLIFGTLILAVLKQLLQGG